MILQWLDHFRSRGLRSYVTGFALQRVPYDVLDAQGHVVAAGETSELSRELPAGSHRVRMNVLGQTLEQSATIVADETTALALETEDNQVMLRQPEQGPSQ
jgi:hypothetical protein